MCSIPPGDKYRTGLLNNVSYLSRNESFVQRLVGQPVVLFGSVLTGGKLCPMARLFLTTLKTHAGGTTASERFGFARSEALYLEGEAKKGDPFAVQPLLEQLA